MNAISNFKAYVKSFLRLPKTVKEIHYKIDDLHENMNARSSYQLLFTESLFSIYHTLPELRLLPKTGGWAGAPDFLSKILETILREQPNMVVEASSGVSTVITGLALKLNQNGTSISLEHDGDYAKISRRTVEINPIGNLANIVHCPLTEHTIDKKIWKWYDLSNVQFEKKIDMLIVDGPPTFVQPLARYPAVPLLFPHFADRVLILLDDANRPDEMQIVKDWIAYFENNNYITTLTEYKQYDKGLAVLEAKRK